MDPHSKPWSSLFEMNSPALQVFYLDELLKSLKEKKPKHPLLIVFQPYLQRDKTILEKGAGHYYNQIQDSSLSSIMKESLSEIFINWLLIRFHNKRYQEILKMLTLTTSLEETVAYKELVAIGERKGLIEGERKGERKGLIKGEKKEMKMLKRLKEEGNINEEIYQSLIIPIEKRIKELSHNLEQLLRK